MIHSLQLFYTSTFLSLTIVYPYRPVFITLLKYPDDMFPCYNMHSDVEDLESHNSVLPVSKELILKVIYFS